MLLLEAGGRDNYHWIHIPIGYLYCIGNPRTDWRYRTRAEPGLNGRSLLYPRGRVLGGSSSINGMIYMRGQREDYDGWARAVGDAGWRWDAVLPLFKRSEDHYRGASEFHGAGGEWRVEAQRPALGHPRGVHHGLRGDAASRARATSNAATISASATSRSTSAAASAGMRRRRSCARLPRARNSTVLTGAQVERLTLEARRCTGLALPRPAAAEHEVARARGSDPRRRRDQLAAAPRALRHRRARACLPRAASSACIALRGVGENLQDHLQLRTVMKVRNARTLNTRVAQPRSARWGSRSNMRCGAAGR